MINKEQLIKLLESLAESFRKKLPDSIVSTSYQSGFDVGYNLGSAHAFERVITKLKESRKGFEV